MKKANRVSRRSFVGLVTGAAASAMMATSAKAQQTGRTDSDSGDRAGYGRTGYSDSDSNDRGGYGRTGATDSDSNDRSGYGRGGGSASVITACRCGSARGNPGARSGARNRPRCPPRARRRASVYP